MSNHLLNSELIYLFYSGLKNFLKLAFAYRQNVGCGYLALQLLYFMPELLIFYKKDISLEIIFYIYRVINNPINRPKIKN